MPQGHRGAGHVGETVPRSGNWHYARPRPYRPGAHRGRAEDAPARAGREMQTSVGMVLGFVKEAGEYTGAHVLSMVRAHYPLIDLKRLEAGYPKEVDPDKAEELRMAQLDLSSKIIGDINLCGGGTAPIQGMPSTS